MENNMTVTMPITLAVKSVRLASRFTKGCVTSSKMPIAKRAKKTSKAESMEGEFLSERMNRNVIAPYATT